ncbi:hypothetical protein FRB94_001814 [Tulasnella sp. JGI-2019a]|nr:hypothetical protein FRB94_001814 [Tulasnella sp. JGI-2019a]
MLFSAAPIIFTATWLTFFTSVVQAGWINNLQPRASGTPSCTASCPGTDTAGFPLANHSVTGSTLFCSYPAFAGEDPNDFFCTYDSSTGALTQDNDAGFCPSSAPVNCPSKKRSSATKRQLEAAKPQAAAVPMNMRSLAALKKSKLAARNLKALEVGQEEK